MSVESIGFCGITQSEADLRECGCGKNRLFKSRSDLDLRILNVKRRCLEDLSEEGSEREVLGSEESFVYSSDNESFNGIDDLEFESDIADSFFITEEDSSNEEESVVSASFLSDTLSEVDSDNGRESSNVPGPEDSDVSSSDSELKSYIVI